MCQTLVGKTVVLSQSQLCAKAGLYNCEPLFPILCSVTSFWSLKIGRNQSFGEPDVGCLIVF